MKLLIIDKDFQSTNLINKKNFFKKNEECFLINFSVINVILPKWLNYKTIDISNIIFSEYKINKNYLKEKFKINLCKNPELVEYKISEINYADKIWNTYFKILAIKSIIKKKKINKIFFFSEKKNNDFSLALKENFTKNYHHIYKNNNFHFNLKNIIKSYYIFFHNFRNELFTSLILFFFLKKDQTNSKKYLYANFPNHWNLKKGYYKLLYNKKNNKYIISVLRNNNNLLNQFKNLFLLRSLRLKNIEILESYNNPIEVFYIYMKSLFSKNKKNSKKLLKNLKLDFLSEEVERNYRLIEKSKNNSLYNGINNLYKTRKFKYLTFPFFEFIDGRVLSKFCNRHNVISYGFQHAYLSENTYSRFFDSPKILYESNFIDYLPKNIFTESIFAKKNLSQLSSINVECYGSFRLKNIRKFYKNNKSRNILFVMDLHNKKYLENILINLKNNNFSKIYVRPHPVYYNEYKYKKFKNINVDLNKNIFRSLKEYKIKYVIISSSTSTFIDLINTDLNIILYKVPNFIRDDIKLKKYFFTLKNINNLYKLKFKKKMRINYYKNIFLPPKIKKNFLRNL